MVWTVIYGFDKVADSVADSAYLDKMNRMHDCGLPKSPDARQRAILLQNHHV